MRYIAVIIPLLVLLISCKPQAQLVTLKSNNPDLDSKFLFEDSLVRISYNFYSQNGTMRFIIYNKYHKPIFINWKNSMLITSENRTLPYWIDQAQIHGQLGDEMSGSIRKKTSTEFLPPHSEIEIAEFDVGAGLRYDKAVVTVENEPVNWKKTGKPAQILHAGYNFENSPLKFRNYLVIDTSEDFKNAKYYDFAFWVSDIQEMDIRQLVGNFFYSENLHKTNDSLYHPYKSTNRFYVIF